MIPRPTPNDAPLFAQLAAAPTIPFTAAARRRVHGNSHLSYAQLDNLTREERVLRAVRELGRATDRQVMARLGYSDPNAVRPRITELVESGVLRECGSVKCPVTERMVRRVEINQ